MARAFNTTLGIGTTDQITTDVTNTSTYRTVALWTYRRGAGASNAGRMFFGNGSCLFFNNNTNSRYTFNYTHSITTGEWDVPFPATLVWVHVAITYDSTTVTNDPIIYLNGATPTQTERTTPVGVASSTAGAFHVGNQSGIRCWDGYVADFAVWNRILTPQEIRLIYDGQSPLQFPAALVEYLPLQGPLLDSKTRRLSAVATGTKVALEHPKRIIGPTRFRRYFADAVAAGGGETNLIPQICM